MDWSWYKDWNYCARANLHFKRNRRRGMNGRTFSQNPRRRGKKPPPPSVRESWNQEAAATAYPVLFSLMIWNTTRKRHLMPNPYFCHTTMNPRPNVQVLLKKAMSVLLTVQWTWNQTKTMTVTALFELFTVRWTWNTTATAQINARSVSDTTWNYLYNHNRVE